MPDHYPLMIPNAASSATTLEVTNPYDGNLIATLDTADAEAAGLAMNTASALYNDRNNWLPITRRIEVLNKAAVLMDGRAEELALLIACEGGKPLVDARIEVARAIDGIRLCIEAIRTQSGNMIPMDLNAASAGRLAFTRHEPIGVVLAFSAFNHPLNLIVHQVGPAVAAGCPVIIKPAEATPLSCIRFVQILREAGLPEAWCQVAIVNDLDVAGNMVANPEVGFFSFIGSAKVGWMLRSRLAPGARCALEHGGAAPVIVETDADLGMTVPLLAKGGFYHAGQVCVSVQRIFAHASIARDLADRLAVVANKMVVGDAANPKTGIGPLIRSSEVARVHDWVNDAVTDGAELVCGGKPISDSCFAATVLFDPPGHSLVSRREIFGPVVCVYPYDALDEAIDRANVLEFAFQAAIFTRDLDAALAACRQLDAAAVMVNDHTAFRVDWMPFAGLKQSGLGTGGIAWTMHDMQIEKLIVIRSDAL
ncbi:MAG: aldehyde dehydrogenase family protein [Mariprofundaceae bacterium]